MAKAGPAQRRHHWYYLGMLWFLGMQHHYVSIAQIVYVAKWIQFFGAWFALPWLMLLLFRALTLLVLEMYPLSLVFRHMATRRSPSPNEHAHMERWRQISWRFSELLREREAQWVQWISGVYITATWFVFGQPFARGFKLSLFFFWIVFGLPAWMMLFSGPVGHSPKKKKKK